MGESLLEKLDKEDGYSLLFDKGEVKRIERIYNKREY